MPLRTNSIVVLQFVPHYPTVTTPDERGPHTR